MTVEHTDPSLVTDVKITEAPRSGQTRSGYGGAIPTRWMIRYAGRWHRVLMMQYGNSGSAYVRRGGRELFLDTDTEYRVKEYRRRLSCVNLFGHHSDDTVHVYAGKAEPYIVCGLHAAYLTPDDYPNLTSEPEAVQ